MTTFWTLGQTDTKHHFDSNKKVRFYTGMPSGEILMVVFEHVTKYVTHRTQSLNRFQEIYNFTDQAAVKRFLSRICLPLCGFDIHSFKDLFIVDGGDGFATFSPSFLARQGKSLEDNAYVLSVRFWKAGHSNY